ncbi:MAG: acyl-CoA dehydratase activase-related protein [Asgard group archaeon]|nr:acyl-CoA dehydratase activase-related protein [Asgard group archaeon]
MTKKENIQNEKIKIGIPRGLIYYHYPKLIDTFFKVLGAEIIYSQKTTKKLLLEALLYASDEECFSAKVFMGHVNDLRKKELDYIFLPKFHGKHKSDINCPKFIGLPYVLKAIFDDLPPQLGYYHSRTKANHRIMHLMKIFLKTGWKVTKNPFRIIKAIYKAFLAHKEYEEQIRLTKNELKMWERDNIRKCIKCDHYIRSNRKRCPKCNFINKIYKKTDAVDVIKVALLGHSYVLEDPILSFQIQNRLKELGVECITSEELPKNIIDQQLEKLYSRLYFKEERRIVGTALYFLETKSVDGIIQLIPFPCGPSAVSSEIIMHYGKRYEDTPLLQLMVDDNTGEAGFQTRLEAFVTMLRRKKFAKIDNKNLILETSVPVKGKYFDGEEKSEIKEAGFS